MANKNVEKVTEYLKKARVYYLATVEGDQPRVRPFGTVHIFENKLYILTSAEKPVAKQIETNPKVELSATIENTWVRITAELVKDDRKEVHESLLEDYPSLKAVYTPGDENTRTLYLKNATAVFYSFDGEPETVKF